MLCAGEGLCVKTERARIFRENQVQIQRLPMSLARVLGLFGEAWWDPPRGGAWGKDTGQALRGVLRSPAG